MMRSLFSGISGLKVHQTKMDVIANNIANVNTVGYKSSRVTFSDFFSQSLTGATGASATSGKGGTNPMQIGLGVSIGSIDISMNPGLGQRTDKSTDLMIEGSSFFIVGDNNGNSFTRAGDFSTDAKGNLVNSAGLHVMGWNMKTDPANPTELVPDKMAVKPIVMDGDKVSAPPEPTTTVGYSGNMSITDSPINTTTQIYDSLGTSYTIDTQMVYDPTTQTWSQNLSNFAYPNGDRKNPIFLTFTTGSEGTAPSTPSTPGTIVFDHKATALDVETKTNTISTLGFNTNGDIPVNPQTGIPYTRAELAAQTPPMTNGSSLIDPVTGYVVVNVTALPGVLPANATLGNQNLATSSLPIDCIGFDIRNLTQYTAPTSATSTPKDGNIAGTLSGISVGKDGSIVGSYTNGTTRVINQIAVATFTNPAGLEKTGNNLFQQTRNSGTFDGIGQDVTANGGSIDGGVLEMSNVDLSTEFTEMITTERGFQANSKTITTSDEMLQDLVNLKR